MTNQIVALPPATGWMQIMHQLVDSGMLANMHISAAALYIAIKRYVDYRTGYAEVSCSRLCKAIGVSKPTYYKARKSLVENGLISVTGKRSPTRYVVHERLISYSADQTPIACTVFPYIPSLQRKILDALKNQPVTSGQIGTTVSISSVNVQILDVTGLASCGKGTLALAAEAVDFPEQVNSVDA